MEYEVEIPDEILAVVEWEREGLPAIGVVNQALVGFEPKVVFAWHLSVIVDCVDLAERGMPTSEEVAVLDRIGDEFDENIKADGNALFLARVTWNGTRQFLYRVYDPEVANAYLVAVAEGRAMRREFEFRMEHDEAWEYAAPYLSPWSE